MDSSLKKAIELLKQKCNVIPDRYAQYRGGYLFSAYPPGTTDKENFMNPFYIVNLHEKVAGLFSPAFDTEGFFKATENFKPL